MNAILLAALLAASPAWPTDYTAVLREVMRNEEANREMWLHYTFEADIQEEELAEDGSVKERTRRKVRLVPTEQGFEITLLEKDGREPTPRELQKYEKRNAKARRKAGKDRGGGADAKAQDGEEERDEEGNAREAWVVNTIRLVDPRFVGPEERDGRRTLRYEFAPRPGAEARDLNEKFLHNIEGTMWVDEAERVVVEIEARSVGRVRIKGGLAGLRDLDFRIRNAKVRDGVWFPESYEVLVELRILLGRMRTRTVTTYSNYRRAGVEVEEGPVWLPGAEPQPSPPAVPPER